jgi:hypothetical protein
LSLDSNTTFPIQSAGLLVKYPFPCFIFHLSTHHLLYNILYYIISFIFVCLLSRMKALWSQRCLYYFLLMQSQCWHIISCSRNLANKLLSYI